MYGISKLFDWSINQDRSPDGSFLHIRCNLGSGNLRLRSRSPSPDRRALFSDIRARLGKETGWPRLAAVRAQPSSDWEGTRSCPPQGSGKLLFRGRESSDLYLARSRLPCYLVQLCEETPPCMRRVTASGADTQHPSRPHRLDTARRHRNRFDAVSLTHAMLNRLDF